MEVADLKFSPFFSPLAPCFDNMTGFIAVTMIHGWWSKKLYSIPTSPQVFPLVRELWWRYINNSCSHHGRLCTWELQMMFPRARDQKSGVSGIKKKKGDNLTVAAAIINKCNRTKEHAGMGHKWADKSHQAKGEHEIIFSFAQRITVVWNLK